ncbi:MAG: DNA polymerase Y family protein, partial [Polyangiaceae bacterium]|nr:DNA polymerase Y family protein [Polyangiaceae bacterium]
MPGRRIASIVLPRLLCELAKEPEPDQTNNPTAKQAHQPPIEPGYTAARDRRPFGVVLLQDSDDPSSVRATSPISAFNFSAMRFGLRKGLTIAEATAFCADLEVRVVRERTVAYAVERVADAAFEFSPIVGISESNAIQLDLTGVTHLHENEASLLRQIRASVKALGHESRIAIAHGPKIAEIIARYGSGPLHVVEPGTELQHMRNLPVFALPISNDIAEWLEKLGIRTIGEFRKLPKDQLAARLGGRHSRSAQSASAGTSGSAGTEAAEAIALAQGYDSFPLKLYTPQTSIYEHTSLDYSVH